MSMCHNLVALCPIIRENITILTSAVKNIFVAKSLGMAMVVSLG